ncbi:MAG TPA: hypothetical protein HA263_05855 [Methanoregulaceae archaeon]|nr:hypothetical protein [Methanoregulaceae archaeon]
MRKELVLGLLLLLAGAIVVVPVTAIDPHTTEKGQPNQNCEEIFPGGMMSRRRVSRPQASLTRPLSMPEPGLRSSMPNSPHAVSQYDVACFQQVQRMLRNV